MIAVRRLLTFAVLAAALFAATPARASGPEPWVERVAALGELWGTVRHLHPLGSERTREWDRAFLDHVRAAMDAKDGAAYRDAVSGMLATLGDPATRVVDPEGAASPAVDAEAPGTRWQGRTLVIRYGDGSAFTPAAAPSIVAEIARATAVVVDLRATDDDDSSRLEAHLEAWAPTLVQHEVEMPALRCVVHTGWVSQTFTSSGGYHSGLRTMAAETIQPTKGAHPRRIVFLLGERSPLPALAIALQADGTGGIVAARDLGAEQVAHTTKLELPHGVVARVRTCDVLAGGRGLVALPVDRRSTGSRALGVALGLAGQRGTARRPAFEPQAPRFRHVLDERWTEPELPTLEHRLLAAVRLHETISAFFPYLDLTDRDWDESFRELLPRFREAADAREYAEAVLELSARLDDSHVQVFGGKTDDVIGEVAPPIRVHMIEGKPTIVRVLDEASAKLVRVGDVIVGVDGKSLTDRMAAMEKYVSASTPARKALQLANWALEAREGQDAKLVIERAGKRREVVLPRRRALRTGWKEPGPEWRMLDGGIGYVNLRKLQVDRIDAMFDALGQTRAIVFDMRGYPNGTGWAIAARLALAGHDHRVAAQFLCREATMLGGTRYFEQRVTLSDKARYRGRVVMLIDEETISQAEHTGLLFEAANHVTFVGQPTAGANGDVTDLTLPGGLRVTFTGQAVRHGDGRRLQRIGIVPDVRVAPTIAGLRAGKDEVLDRALVLLRRDGGADRKGAAKGEAKPGRRS